MKKKDKQCKDVVIIGSGIAGLYTALSLPDTLQITILTKAKIGEGSTRWAQGGIAVVLDEQDSFESHINDTLVAGDGLCDKKAVEVLVKEGPECIKDLIARGMQFDQEEGKIAFTREAAHSYPRIIHAGGDATGKKLEEFLSEQILQKKHIHLQQNAVVYSLEKNKNGQSSTIGYFQKDEKMIYHIQSKIIVIATGGCGQVYLHTTNPKGSTGAGLQFAQQLGLQIKDMEFIQFHPTALRLPEDGIPEKDFLISESVRGEGGMLLNHDNKRFMERYDERLELAPRDVVTRAIWQEMQQERRDHVYLSITHVDAEHIKHRFPTIYEECLQHGIDITQDPIPVSPTAHYQMGGIVTDFNARSSDPDVYVIGETACTGVHGANRLASNSLLEALVFGRRAAQAIATQAHPRVSSVVEDSGERYDILSPAQRQQVLALITQIKQLMWEEVGIVRSTTGLLKAKQQLAHFKQKHQKERAWRAPLSFALENIITIAELVITSALERKKSVGAHYRID